MTAKQIGVVTSIQSHNQKILINSEKVDDFELQDGSEFRNFKGNDSYTHHSNGFYEIISDGEIKVLAKAPKELKSQWRNSENYTQSYLWPMEDLFYWNNGNFDIRE